MSTSNIFSSLLKKSRGNVGVRAQVHHATSECSAACIEQSRQLLCTVLKYRRARFQELGGLCRNLVFIHTREMLDGEISRLCSHLTPTQRAAVLHRSMRGVFGEYCHSQSLFCAFLELCE
jgi:hypothetical protein